MDALAEVALPGHLLWVLKKHLSESSFAGERARRFVDWYDSSIWAGADDERCYKAAWNEWLRQHQRVRFTDWWRIPPDLRAQWFAPGDEAHEEEYTALYDFGEPEPVDITTLLIPMSDEHVRMARLIARMLTKEREALRARKAAADRGRAHVPLLGAPQLTRR